MALLMFFSLLGMSVLFLFLFYYFWFLRDPKRPTPREGIVSPADGTIARIIPIKNAKPDASITIPKGLLGKIRARVGDVTKNGYLIVIVMTPLDMHYQKAPCEGRVLGTRHVQGKFLNAVRGASDLRATFENEHNSILLETPHGRIKVIQIAGFLARRIHCFVNPGQIVQRKQNLGIIKLGSQVCIIMPKLKLSIKEGQHVLAGSTVIAEP